MKKLALFGTVLSLTAAPLYAVDWRPVDPSELAQKAPKVDPGADAEAIFWDVRVEDRLQGGDLSLSLTHYIRIKIYTDLGREQYATVEIPRTGRRAILDVAGRTIKPDGTIVELKKDAIFDRELVKTKGLKLKGKSFTLPNVAPGDIIEYTYRERRDNESASYMRLYFQRELPMWNVTYHIKPLETSFMPFAMRSMAFSFPHPPMVKENNGFFGFTATNVPAFLEEPYMPPEDNLRAWILIYYEEDKKLDADKFWKEVGKSDFAGFKPFTEANKDVKRTAAELVTGLNSDADKLKAIEAFCRTKIRNIHSGMVHLTPEERKAIKDNRSPADTLKQKSGTGLDINELFIALATSAGFDARMARIADRSDYFFTQARPITYFIKSFSVAVKQGNGWTFFDPSTDYLEPGMLRWQEEGTHALVSDPKEGFFVKTQFSDEKRSRRTRRANFKLSEDGTLEGTVEYTYAGHNGRQQRTRYEDMTPGQQEDEFKADLKDRLSTAEISAFEMANLTDTAKPFTIRHKVTVPGYATRTGKRLLVQPAYFQRNLPPRLTAAKRKYDLYFDHPWGEEDEVTIELPDDWQIDQPVQPKSTKLGEVGEYTVMSATSDGGRKLVYRRQFEWGRGNRLLIPLTSYPSVKSAFDFMQEQDGYTIALREVAGAK